MKTSKRGRPPKEISERRSAAYNIRFTPDEYEHLQKAAIDNQMKVSTLIRTALCSIGVIPIRENTLK